MSVRKFSKSFKNGSDRFRKGNLPRRLTSSKELKAGNANLATQYLTGITHSYNYVVIF